MNLRNDKAGNNHGSKDSPQQGTLNQEKTDHLKCYFSMLGENQNGFWVDSRGLSMLPIFYQGVRVHIDTDIENFEIGEIAVFYRNNKFIAHRIVGLDSGKDLYITKGDTLFFFDEPVKKDELLGKVDFVMKRGRKVSVSVDRKMADISRKIGRPLTRGLQWMPGWLKFLYYFTFFIPSYLIYSLTRQNVFNFLWK